MRIAVVHNLTRGGAHRRLAEQVAALGADVVEFTTPLATPVTDRPYLVPAAVHADRLPAPLRPPRRLRDLRALRVAWLALGDLAERCGADVIYANPDSVLRGGVPLGQRSVPIVRFCDEPRRIDYEPALRTTLNPWTRALYSGLRARERETDRAALAEATVVVTNSHYTAGRILTAYGRRARPVPCGVPAAMTPLRPPAAPAHLLSVGALVATKGHDLAIGAAALSGLDLPLVVVAPHDVPAERARLTALADHEGVRLRIRLGIPDEQLIDLYRHAYATLYLATAEPLGLASLEAQACGSPVVVAAEGGLPETVHPGRTGLVVDRSAPDAALALRALAESGLRDRLARAAAAEGGNRDWAASAAALLDIADSLVRTHRVEAPA